MKRVSWLLIFSWFALTSFAAALDEINFSFTKPAGTPYIVGAPEMNVDAEEFTTLIIKIKSDKSATARLFWASSLDQQMNEPKSLLFFLDKSDTPKEYVFNVKSQNPYWIGFIPQILIFPDGGSQGVEIESAKAVLGNLFTNIRSGWREFFFFEAPQLRSANFIYAPKINGLAANIYIYWLIIIFFLSFIAYEFLKNKKRSYNVLAKRMILICLFFWMALDGRIILDQSKTAALDFHAYYGKTLEEKRGLTTLGDFYDFISFVRSKLPAGQSFDLLHPGN